MPLAHRAFHEMCHLGEPFYFKIYSLQNAGGCRSKGGFPLLIFTALFEVYIKKFDTRGPASARSNKGVKLVCSASRLFFFFFEGRRDYRVDY